MAKFLATDKLKLIDKLIGTPVGYILGSFDRICRLIRKPGPLATPNKILAICWIGLGDVILTLPAIKSLRQKYPQAKISYFTTPRATEVLKGVPEISEVIIYDPTSPKASVVNIVETVNRLRTEKFDLTVDFSQRYRLPILMAYLAGIPHRIGFAIPGQGRSWLLTQSTPYIWPLAEPKAFGQIITKILLAPNVSDSLPKLDFPQTNPKLNQQQSNIVLHLGSGNALTTRRWPDQNFLELAIELIKSTNDLIVLTGTKDDADLAASIVRQLPEKTLDLTGKTTLPELYQVFSQAKLAISCDTGPMHLAAASGTPTLGLFLASFPEKWRPYGPQHAYLYHGPSLNDYYSKYHHFIQHPRPQDIQNINVEEVIRQAIIMLRKHENK